MSVKVISSNTRQTFVVDLDKRYSTCPECSHTRRKSKDKCVSWRVEEKRGHCWHCSTTFFEHNPREVIEYIVPDWKNITKLSDKAVRWFNGRMIRQETLNKMRVYSDQEWMPQFRDKGKVEVICFPYFFKGNLINIKYRAEGKAFRLHTGSELILWNLDKIGKKVVIVEGEIDLLSFVEIGIDWVVSVPNGANKTLDYLDGYIELFKDCEVIYLATDNDEKGIILRDELARRLGVERCWLVNFRDKKDANAYHVEYGGADLRKALDEAKRYPVKGIVQIDQIYHEILALWEDGVQPGVMLGMEEIDKYVSWELGRLAIVSGVPAHGKTSVVDFLVALLNIKHGWKAAFFTPENYPLKFHYAKMYAQMIGTKFGKAHDKSDGVNFNLAYDYMRENYFYIMDEEDHSIDMILEAAKSLVRGKGIKVLVIDPYNKIDHNRERGVSETDYISTFLDRLLRFAQMNGVLVILVAHPRKMSKKKGELKFEVPTLYDISGSANFYNKADYGFTIYRDLMNDTDGTVLKNEVEIHWQKIKFRHLGVQGVSNMRYNINSGRFQQGLASEVSWDNTNWLMTMAEDVESLDPLDGTSGKLVASFNDPEDDGYTVKYDDSGVPDF